MRRVSKEVPLAGALIDADLQPGRKAVVRERAKSATSAPLSRAHQRLIQLLAQAAVDELLAELEKTDSTSNATGEAEVSCDDG